MVYVSITGLRIKSPLHALRFWWHAVASMAQARGADGNVSAEARSIEGVQHTLSVWRDRDAMIAYRNSGAHLKAMRVFPRIASGHTLGFESDRAPDWSTARDLWLAEEDRRRSG
ncbi:hypothetical protein [Amorphus orientalis]|uniref:Quinol monooxygenase YgiN n=1 Tax=Amorphus orientalis TaxID=649198 RepID=A0AAE3VLM9_9HYPH|nr:hypothetical protein [Amorphus orientalis]MDQ0313926.1 quinol monooxygenase YgiN [Amorphus orientalis]